MGTERQLNIPGYVPEGFAQAVATVLLLGIAASAMWEEIFTPPPETSLSWIEGILGANDVTGLVHSDISWWEHQLRGH
jgi:hypothetical protein